MQNVFPRDMFTMGSFDGGVKCNGHVQLPGRTAKKDRKGCKKEKIETVLKNRLITSPKSKTSTVKLSKINVKPKNLLIKPEYHEYDEAMDAVLNKPFSNEVSIFPDILFNNINNQFVNNINNQFINNINNQFVNNINHQFVNNINNQFVNNINNQFVNNINNQFVDNINNEIINNINHQIVNNIICPTLTPTPTPPPPPPPPPSSPPPPPVDVPEQVVENHLSTEIEPLPRKPKTKKRYRSRAEKIGFSGNKKSDKIDPSCVTNKNQLSCNVITISPKRKYAKLTNWQKDCGTRHETLQRMLQECENVAKFREDLYPLDLLSSDVEDADNPLNLEFEDVPYQQFWLPTDQIDPTDRDAKVDNLRSVLRRKFHQLSTLPDNSPSPDLVLALTDAVRYNPICISKLESQETPGPNTKLKRNGGITLVQQKCCLEICHSPAIPCTRHCFKHILRNVDQLLFEHCSARTIQGPCTNAVFNVCDVQPLCFEHLYCTEQIVQAEEVPIIVKSKSRKRPKNSLFKKVPKRSKKKRTQSATYPPLEPPPYIETIVPNVIEPIIGPCTNDLPQNIGNCDVTSLYSSVTNSDIYLHPVNNIITNEVEVGDEVLADLDAADLVSHESRLLDDHDDITSVFSQIPVDAFNDLFTVDKNGQYVPSPEETEELERALEAVDMDVRSLERLSQTHMAHMSLDPASLLADLPIPPFSSS